MFDNIGDKIKTLASVITILGIIVSLIVGVNMISTNKKLALTGLLVMALGSLFSWIGSFLLYGFGQLIENSDKLVKLYLSDGIATNQHTDSLSNNTEFVHQNNERLNTLNDWLNKGLIAKEEYLKEVEATKNEK